ncbi:hypothetical protein GQ54DRAFT_300437 [Martensiomyces pterosporus]|nr:hypothetical protein GQ54DRAFT_300437 [Martensiomyces pterosporus]
MSQTDEVAATLTFPKPSEFDADKRVQLIEETGHYIFTDPNDGMEYEYDENKGAWFPMWNEALIEQQQSAYGDGDEEQAEDAAASTGAKRKPKDTVHQGHPKRENTSVYISGLPLDTTEEEVAEYFSQCGAIMPDISTNKPRVRLYRDNSGRPKGDGLVTYFKAPSVQLALDILDDSQFRTTEPTRISVQKAVFEEKDKRGSDKAETSKRSRVDPKLIQRRLNQLEKQLDWFEGGGEIAERYKRTVILKHMFTLQELEEDVTLLLDLTEDVREECEKLGAVSSVKIYDMSEEGVISVKFKDELAARACVKAMNGRFFAGQQIEASIYDGHTRYKSSAKNASVAAASGSGEQGTAGNEQNDDDEEAKRMEKYSEWLDSGN